MNLEEREAFEERLGELVERGASREVISLLTEVAKDFLETGSTGDFVVSLVERRMRLAPPSQRLALFYLVDSILKNVGSHYIGRFQKILPSLFSETFLRVEKSVKDSMIRMHKTWVEARLFDQQFLQKISTVFTLSQFAQNPLPLPLPPPPTQVVEVKRRPDNPHLQTYLKELKELDLILQWKCLKPVQTLPTLSPLEQMRNGALVAPLPSWRVDLIRASLLKNELARSHIPMPVVLAKSEVALDWDNFTSKGTPHNLIGALYNPKTPPCLQCGLRNRDKPSAVAHLDWHFRNNKLQREKTVKARSRQWFSHFRSWISRSLVAASSSESAKIMIVEGKEEEEPMPVAVAREDQLDCPVCGEDFEQIWDADEEEWFCTDTVLWKEDDTLYHSRCLPPDQDSRKRSLLLVDSIISDMIEKKIKL